jgi:NADH-quinone oxidoreductase subunit L
MHFVWLVPAIPLAMAAINLLFGHYTRKVSGLLASLAVAASFVIAVAAVIDLVSKPAESRVFVDPLFEWIRVGWLNMGVTLRLDPLSATMIVMVSGVACLIHFYSIGYMHGDPRYPRFFAYMNLFVFFMLMLVLGNNYLLLYLGWEGVGLCSYLLIGFWFEDRKNAVAAKKAFITTRIGDTFLMIGLIVILVNFHSLDFTRVLNPTTVNATLGASAITAVALLLFGGAVGKSAQFPLHVWLADAMAGPTPVSALIHAATMVTAGVYLVCRSHVFYDLSPSAANVVMFIGLFTALYAATAAMGQNDFKRALAYSTMSQLGYMFFAAGLGDYTAAMVMLVLHAFYKALMFLGAGSAMHGLGGHETDMRKMGGLKKSMPVTATLFTIGAICLSGIPPFAGFWAKDPILSFADRSGHLIPWLIALFTAFLSGLYIVRIAFATFFGHYKGDKHPHESPRIMTFPMGVLAVLSVIGGVFAFSATTGILPKFLDPVLGAAPEASGGLPEAALIVIGSIVAIAAVALGWYVYGSGKVDWVKMQADRPGLFRFLEKGWYIDALYEGYLVRPARWVATTCAYALDMGFVDGIVNGVGKATTLLAAGGRKIQTGLVRSYAAAILLGAVVVMLLLVVWR